MITKKKRNKRRKKLQRDRPRFSQTSSPPYSLHKSQPYPALRPDRTPRPVFQHAASGYHGEPSPASHRQPCLWQDVRRSLSSPYSLIHASRGLFPGLHGSAACPRPFLSSSQPPVPSRFLPGHPVCADPVGDSLSHPSVPAR